MAVFKLAFPLWTITRAGTGLREFRASRGGLAVNGKTLYELAQRIHAVEKSWPS
jgi:hypothetical protein